MNTDETLEIEAAPAPTDGQMRRIVEAARQIVRVEREIARLSLELTAKNRELKHLQESALPEAMQEAGVEAFQLEGGYTVEVRNLLVAAIPRGVKGGSEDLRPQAFARLEEQGAGALVKHQITILFGKGEEKWAQKFMADCAKRRRPLHLAREDSVHPGSLAAFCRERRDAGLLDQEDRRLYGVFEQNQAQVKPPKSAGVKGGL